VIDIDNISYTLREDGYATVKFYKFTEDSVETFNALWDTVVNKIDQDKPKGLIIDLRNNPGGYVSSVEYVLTDFLGKDKVLFRNRTGWETA
jgi:carboxyl-terminal processing protease